MAILSPAARQFRSGLAAVGLLLALAGASRADVEEIAPADGRISLTVAGAAALPQRYVRQTGSGATCETASWDSNRFFGEVGHCAAIGDRFWRRGYVTIDLLLAHFPFLEDFLVEPPSPRREVVTVIGAMTLYGFAVEDMPGSTSQCTGFVRGYDSSGTGYREFLVGYVCADQAARDDAAADDLMHGLAVRGAFGALLP